MSLSFVKRCRLVEALSFAALVLAAVPIHAQVVGTTSAVNPNSSAAGHTLTTGTQIIHNDSVHTDAKGSLQLLFIDRTSMSVGPNADLVIDDYVFDTKTNTGSMTVSLGRGLMRFIGGQVTHGGETLIKTPAALFGIRGGTAQFSVGTKGTQAVFLGGNSPGAGLTVTTTGPCQQLRPADAPCPAQATMTITTPGYGITVSNSTTGALQQAPVPAGTLAAQNTQLTSSPGTGQTGGAPAATVARVVTLSNITPDPTTPIITSSAATSPNASGGSSTSSSTTGGVTSSSSAQTLNNATLSAQQSTQTNAAAATISQSFGPAAFALTVTRCCDPNNQTSAAPFIPAGFATAGNTLLSNVLGYRNASPAGTNALARGAFMQYGVNITGTGAAQSSWFYVATGAFIDNGSGGLLQQGRFDGTDRASVNARVFTAEGNISSPAGAVTTDLNGLPTSATINDVYYNTTTGQYVPNDPNHPTQYTAAGVTTPYTYTATEQATAVPVGLGSNRPNVTLNGYVGGIMLTRNVNLGVNIGNPFIVSNANGLPGDVTVQLDSTTSRVQANFNVSRQSGAALANIFNTASYQFGSLSTANPAQGTYVDYDNFAARGGVVRTDQTGGTAPISTVNGSAVSSQTQAFVAIKPTDAQAIFGGYGNSTQFCQCDFTRWGFWSAQTNRPAASGDFRDNGNLMLWVAGQLPGSSADVPTTGIATYFGHVVVNILNTGKQYVDAGNFQNVVNFGAGTGTVNVGGPGIGPGIDGSTYSGTVNLLADRRDFNGALAGTVAGRTMNMAGSFFRGTAGPVGEMGGNVNITGPGGYLGSGIFAGKQH